MKKLAELDEKNRLELGHKLTNDNPVLLYFKLGYTTVPAVVALSATGALPAGGPISSSGPVPATCGPVSSSGLLPFCFFFVTDRWGFRQAAP